jgi:hypothetical protein
MATRDEHDFLVRLAQRRLEDGREDLVRRSERIAQQLEDCAKEVRKRAADLFTEDERVTAEERINWLVNSVAWVFPNLDTHGLQLASARYAAAREVLRVESREECQG